MKLAKILALLAIAVALSSSTVVAESVFQDSATTSSGLLSALAANTAKAACAITYTLWYDDNAVKNGYWPQSACAGLTGTTYQFQPNGAKLTIKTAPSNPDSTQRVAMLGFSGDGNVLPGKDMRETQLVQEPTTKFNDFTTTGIIIGGQTRQAVEIMDFQWCGETVDITYDSKGGTAFPSAVDLWREGDNNNPSLGDNCQENVYDSWTNPTALAPPGAYSTINAYFSTAQSPKFFDLPGNIPCAQYAIDVYKAQWDDWAPYIKTNGPVIMQNANTGYRYERENPNTDNGKPNSLDVNLTNDSNGKLQSIHIVSKDLSSGVGGIEFKLYCVDPIDPDTDSRYCLQPNDWLGSHDSTIASQSSGINACCGDDATDVGSVAPDSYTCTYNSTDSTYSWKAQAEITCPSDPGSYYPGGGCCTAAKAGYNVTNSTDDALCLQDSTGWRWQNASKLQNIDTNGTRIVSNGTRWLACLNEPTITVSAAPQPAATNNPDTGQACTQTTDCSANTQCYTNYCESSAAGCAREAGTPDPSSPYQECQQEYSCNNDCNTNFPCIASVPCSVAGTTCNATTNSCVCGNDYTWSGNQCVPYSACANGYTPNPSGTQCIATSSVSTSVTLGISVASSCNLANNSLLTTPTGYICLNNWTVDDGSQQFFNSTNEYVGNFDYITINTPLKDQVTQVCKAGQLVNATRKYPENYSGSSFCEDNQCYSSEPGASCVNTGTWVLGHECINTATPPAVEGGWTTRQEFLAEVLFNKSPSRFVLQCDSAASTLNAPPDNTYLPSQTNKAGAANSFCILSSTAGNAIAAGAVLNTASLYHGIGNQSISTIDAQAPSFLLAINSSDNSNVVIPGTSNTITKACDSALANNNDFNKCTATTGSLWYNNQHGLLIFSKDSSFSPAGDTLLNSLKQAWDRLLNGKRTDLFQQLNGEQIYVAGNGPSKTVQGVVQYTPNGREAEIVYNGINATAICNAFSGKPELVESCTYTGGLYVVRLLNPTPEEWQAFTLKVRP